MTPDTNNPKRRGFPFITVGATLILLFLFLGVTWAVWNSPSPFEKPKAETSEKPEEEPKPDPATRLDNLNKRNQDALDGVGAKKSQREAHAELIGKLKGPNDKLPFPIQEPTTTTTTTTTTTPPPKKDGKEKP